MRILAEEALAEFPTKEIDVQTSCGVYKGLQTIPKPDEICAVSIVRSGDALLEAVRDVEPSCRVGKILIQRDEEHPQKIAKLFYSKFPPGIASMYVLLCDPMMGTGGSGVKALEVLQEAGVDMKKVVFANMLCCPEGVNAVGAKFPDVKIVSVCMDPGMNEDKYLVPGLGDYGDRFFNT